jgi:thiamine-phosphate pyrophosphorylase
MSLAPPEGHGPLRRERLRTARLYLVCEAMPGGRDPEALLQAALSGGVDIVQLREKELGRDEIERSAQTFRRLCDTYSALFIVNDDPYLARTCNADGVHVGQDDASAGEARELLGPEAIVGLSTHSEAQLAASTNEPVDYVSVGPIWETPTKEGRPGVGLELIEHAAENAPHPFFAIGGIDTANAEQVVRAGAERLCVVRAVRDAADPEAAAAQLRQAFAGGDKGVAPGG